MTTYKPQNSFNFFQCGPKEAVIMRNITKRFPGVVANDAIDLTVYDREILGLLGENGAGKTVLMSILSGIYRPDSGEIYVYGKRVTLHSPAAAIEQGIGMVHQHFMLIPELTVLENIILGREPAKLGFCQMQRAERQIEELQKKYKLAVDLHELVSNLPVGLRQRVEILKILYRQANIIILDEPTAVLNPDEVKNLFDIMRELKANGKTIIFITHKLREAIEVCDRITVLRRGKVVGTVNASEATQKMLAEMMIGKYAAFEGVWRSRKSKKPVLLLLNVSAFNEKKMLALNDVNLSLHEGEILGIAGVEGNGQTELAEVILGLRKPATGRIILNGVDITEFDVSLRRQSGISYIPEDRQRNGIVPGLTIAENLILGMHRETHFKKGLLFNYSAIFDYCARKSSEYRVKLSRLTDYIENLSGGNQQRVILARELRDTTKVIVAFHPTRGLDIEGTDYIHSKLVEMRDRGAAILLISADLDETLKLSDRVAVMYRGKIVGTMDNVNIQKEQLGLLMSGVVEKP